MVPAPSRPHLSGWPLARVIGGAAIIGTVALVGVRLGLGPKVPAVKPKRGAVIQRVVAAGQIVPNTRIRLTSQVTAAVAEVLVEEGDVVKPQQVLLRLASGEAAALAQQAKAAFDQAEARVEQFQGVSARLATEALKQAEVRLSKARTTANRERELAKVNASTQEALDQALSDLRLAESQYQSAMAQAKAAAPKGADARLPIAAAEQAQALLAAAEAKLSQFTITSPIAARVLSRAISAGDGVQIGTPLLVLGSIDAPRVKVQVDEKYLSLVHPGQAARVTADAYPGRILDAVVERLAPAVNQDRGSVDVQLLINQAPDFLRFDMSASVEIVTNTANNAMILPDEAVQGAATAQPYVLTAASGRVKRQTVTLGLRGDAGVEIASGIAPDDWVLLTSEALADGKRVRPVLSE